MSPENPYGPGTPTRGKVRPTQPPPAPPSTGNDHYYLNQSMQYQSKPIATFFSVFHVWFSHVF